MTKSIDLYDFRPASVASFGVAGVSTSSTEPDYHDYSSSMRENKSRLLEDQCWYHGKIKRIAAVNLMKNNGDFLVRDSISNPGDYVLTGFCRGEPMHFEIHRAPSSNPKIDLYYFEDEQFRSIVDLVEFYYNHRRQVTAKSQFVLLNPVVASSKSNNGTFGRFQMEIEASYAPFINKQAQLAARFDRSLSQTAILNQARKRLNDSEHDLMKLIKEPLPSSKSFSQLNLDQGVKVTSFGIEEGEIVSMPTQVPPPSARPIPKFPPPKSPIAFPEDFDDYDDLDYEAMEQEQRQWATALPINSTPKLPPAVPPKPANLKQKRNSDYLQALQEPEEIIPEPKPITRKVSAHSLFYPTETDREVDEDNNFLPLYLDRTQSCSNLVLRQRSRSSKEQEDESGLKKYPSVKIDPSPLLPARSNTSLSSISALTAILNEKRDDGFNLEYDDLKKNMVSQSEADYDDLKRNMVNQSEADYDKLKENEKPSCSKQEELPPSKPRTFIQMKNSASIGKPMRNLFNFMTSLNVAKLSMLITLEDCKVFQLINSTSTPPSECLKRLFQMDSKLLREEIMDRNACLQLTVLTSLQKSSSPKDFAKLWVMTAAHLLYKIGNGFAFGAIMTALKSAINKRPRLLSELDQQVSALYKGLVPIYEDFLNGKMPQAIAGCFLPFVQPLLQLFSKSDYVHSMKSKGINFTGLENLDILSNLILLARHVLFDNTAKVEDSIHEIQSTSTGNNPLSTESLVHCLLETAVVAELKESEKRKIRQLFEVAL